MGPGTPATHVLVVEDDPGMREALKAMLSLVGFNVRVADHGEEAMALMRGGFNPDVIVLDLWMPVMNGWTFLATARPAVPVILLSGVAEPRPLPRGIAAVLTKPVSWRQLIATIREVNAARQEN